MKGLPPWHVSIDNVGKVILMLGKCFFLGKCDVRNSYLNVPVHPGDRGYDGRGGCWWILPWTLLGPKKYLLQ